MSFRGSVSERMLSSMREQERGIGSAKGAAGADPSGPARQLKKALPHDGPLRITFTNVI
jgi:hypothetical protein